MSCSCPEQLKPHHVHPALPANGLAAISMSGVRRQREDGERDRKKTPAKIDKLFSPWNKSKPNGFLL